MDTITLELTGRTVSLSLLRGTEADQVVLQNMSSELDPLSDEALIEKLINLGCVGVVIEPK